MVQGYHSHCRQDNTVPQVPHNYHKEGQHGLAQHTIVFLQHNYSRYNDQVSSSARHRQSARVLFPGRQIGLIIHTEWCTVLYDALGHSIDTCTVLTGIRVPAQYSINVGYFPSWFTFVGGTSGAALSLSRRNNLTVIWQL